MKNKNEIKTDNIVSSNKLNSKKSIIFILIGALTANTIAAIILLIIDGFSSISVVILSLIPILLLNIIVLKNQNTETDKK